MKILQEAKSFRDENFTGSNSSFEIIDASTSAWKEDYDDIQRNTTIDGGGTAKHSKYIYNI